MTKWDWVFASLCVAWLAALATITGAISGPWSYGSLAEWAAAVGTIAAAGTAVHLASDGPRRQRAAAREQVRGGAILVMTHIASVASYIDAIFNPEFGMVPLRPNADEVRRHLATALAGLEGSKAQILAVPYSEIARVPGGIPRHHNIVLIADMAVVQLRLLLDQPEPSLGPVQQHFRNLKSLSEVSFAGLEQ